MPLTQVQGGMIGSSTVTPSNLSQPLTSGTAVASTSGTSVDFTGIPSWVKRVTVMFNGTSTNGASPVMIQLGAGSVDAASYNTLSVAVYAANNTTRFNTTTTGFTIYGTTVASSGTLYYGSVVFSLLGSNTWVANGLVTAIGDNVTSVAGSKALSGTLDRVRITTVNGTDTFDAGTINILFE